MKYLIKYLNTLARVFVPTLINAFMLQNSTPRTGLGAVIYNFIVTIMTW